MQFFDSKTKNKLSFSKPSANIYLCGPTVYDSAHLGHARSSICFDLLRRTLLASGVSVKFARNYTDIDDKILKKCEQSGQSLEALSEFYIQEYERDMSALNVLEPSFKPRATHFIQEMIDLITLLKDKNLTYTLTDGIYLDTSKDSAYFSLSHRSRDEQQSRLEKEVAKKNESDFVLWKFDAKFYEAPFGAGRPGWHTECVAMIRALFSTELDFHCGGVDLLFPHHENEASQCRCAWGAQLAQIWLHNGFVKIAGEKMSKSLNNSFFVKDILKELPGEALRLYLMSSHYRAHFNFDSEDLRACKKRLDKLYRLKQRLNLKALKDFEGEALSGFTLNDKASLKSEFKGFQSELALNLLKALQDDLNISLALSFLDEFINEANLNLDNKKADKSALESALIQAAQILGIGLLDTELYFQFGVDEVLKKEIESKIALRNEAKARKDYAAADALRNELLAKNIVLKDTPNGVLWEKSE